MNVFPRRSQDDPSTPRTPQGASAPSTRSSTNHDQSARLFPDTDGVDLVRQSAGPGYETTENMVNGVIPIVTTNYGGPPGSPAPNDVDPQNIQLTAMASREGRLVDGFNNDDQSSNGASVSAEHDAIPPQTPAPTSATPAHTSTGSNLALNTQSETLFSFESTGFPQPLNPRSIMADSQINLPPAIQPAHDQRRRRRFRNWLTRHRVHRDGPWVPFIRRNWNAVSDALREVERRGFGPSRRPIVDPELIIDPE
ncbi:hypothetical protein MMC11_004523 [Xylographa trunciseda]|nr:hypothetical protein [Xylographa trunciseda]